MISLDRHKPRRSETSQLRRLHDSPLTSERIGSGAAADPINAKNCLTFPATCDNGQTVQVVVNGNGEFNPAHVVGSTAVFSPQAFDLTFEFIPPGGPTETETDTSSKPNVHGDLVTCSFDTAQPPRLGPCTFGTATGFFTPAS
jgi:hypothetical protein